MAGLFSYAECSGIKFSYFQYLDSHVCKYFLGNALSSLCLITNFQILVHLRFYLGFLHFSYKRSDKFTVGVRGCHKEIIKGNSNFLGGSKEGGSE